MTAGAGPAELRASVLQRFGASARAGAWEWGFWLLLVAAWFVFPRQAGLMNEIAILALFALSLDLILGYGGIVSLGHAAFLGAGAYAAGLFAKHVLADPLAGLAVGIAAAGLLGIATSVLVLRGSHLTRLMVTLGVALILYELANRFDGITGGADGLQGVMMGPLLGVFEFDLGARTAYGYSLAVLLLMFLLARRLVRSPFGYGLVAIRDNPKRAVAIGIDSRRQLATVYAISAAMAGAAGALLAQTSGFVSLDVLDFHRSADVLLVLVIGGVGWLYGGVVGAIAFKVMQDVFSTLTPQYWQGLMGLVLVVLVLFGRDRLGSRLRALWPGRFGQRRGP